MSLPCFYPLLEELRVQGHRLTPQREMIVEAIAHAGRHVTADEVFDQVRARTNALSVTTVYRTLDLLTELGLVSRADLGEGKVSYAPLSHGPHCHLVCRKCGRVVQVDSSVLAGIAGQLREGYDFLPDINHFVIYGLCADCQG